MLMITVMAFAGSYSDALHFEVNLMGAKAVDLPNGTLTIEKRVDGGSPDKPGGIKHIAL